MDWKYYETTAFGLQVIWSSPNTGDGLPSPFLAGPALEGAGVGQEGDGPSPPAPQAGDIDSGVQQDPHAVATVVQVPPAVPPAEDLGWYHDPLRYLFLVVSFAMWVGTLSDPWIKVSGYWFVGCMLCCALDYIAIKRRLWPSTQRGGFCLTRECHTDSPAQICSFTRLLGNSALGNSTRLGALVSTITAPLHQAQMAHVGG